MAKFRGARYRDGRFSNTRGYATRQSSCVVNSCNVSLLVVDRACSTLYVVCMTKVVGYARVSTEHQARDGVSLDAQVAKIRAYALAMDLELVDVIVDAGESAKTLRRPGLQRALAMLASGDAEGLVVTKLDRLTRSVRDIGTLVEGVFSRAALLSIGDSIDTRSAAGRLVLNVLVSVSQWEREAVAERTQTALAHLKAEGVRLGAAPIGYRHTDATDAEGRRVIARVADEAETVARIVDLKRRGASLREIAETLTNEGRRTKRGAAWSAKVVRDVCIRAAV